MKIILNEDRIKNLKRKYLEYEFEDLVYSDFFIPKGGDEVWRGFITVINGEEQLMVGTNTNDEYGDIWYFWSEYFASYKIHFGIELWSEVCDDIHKFLTEVKNVKNIRYVN